MAAVPVSWHIGRMPPAAISAFLSSVERDVAVVGRRLGVIEDGGDLLEMFRPQVERRVVEGVAGEEREGFRGHLEDFLPLEVGGTDALAGQQAVRACRRRRAGADPDIRRGA
jgi:hypothetical protein